MATNRRVHPTTLLNYTSRSRPHLPWALLGCVYLALSLMVSSYYTMSLHPSFLNDLWWAKYNATGHQAFLVDFFNTVLAPTTSSRTVDILAPSATIDQTYSDMVATTQVYPSSARRVVLHDVAPLLHDAVVGLRAFTIQTCAALDTQYCWIDFNRTFELAHTVHRQQRCDARYSTNAAVYLEPVLRNQAWDDFMQNCGGDASDFQVAIYAWLDAMPVGQVWLATTSVAFQITTVDQEVVYWSDHGIRSFTLQWQNFWQTGITDSMWIENALGRQQPVALKSIAGVGHAWTSVVMYWNFLNDLYVAAGAGRSLIRSANNSFLNAPMLDLEGMLGLQDSNGDYVNQVQLFRTSVGPFLSVDNFYVVAPQDLVAYFHAFQSALYGTLRNQPDLQRSLDAVPSLTVMPTPPAWSNPSFVFYGGNPMCLSEAPLPYVQETFSFNDVCGSHLPLTVTITKDSAMLAAFSLSSPTQIVAACTLQTGNPNCQNTLESVTKLLLSFPAVSTAIAPYLQPAIAAITTLNVSLMQFAANDDASNWTLLHQPLLEDPTWMFYGWILLNDFILGKREVVTFEGDVSTLVLISALDEPLPFVSSTATITSATRLIYFLVLYTTVALGVLAVLCILGVFLIRCQLHGQNLFWFNRIASSIWIGRPLMFIRGVTAMLVLSTTQLSLVQTPTLGHARFEFDARPMLATMVIAGEATWVLYVAQDFLAVVALRFTIIYGPLSCYISWLAIVILELTWPVMPTITICCSCATRNLDTSVQCTSGVLQIGSFQRVIVIASIFLGSVVLGSVASGLYRLAGRPATVEAQVVRYELGVADIFFTSTHVSDGRSWTLDKVSCLMAGLVHFKWRQTPYTFDIKLWVVQQDVTVSAVAITFSSLSKQRTIISQFLSPPNANDVEFPSIWRTRLKFTMTTLGVLYALGSIISSSLYLQASQVNLANDMFWANFSISTTHPFLANWLNEQLILGVTSAVLYLDTESISQYGLEASADAPIYFPENYGALMQFSKLNSIEATVLGLRSMDTCRTPWIFTQYCYLDFDQKWEMANSADRQGRCEQMTTNGAVFMESILRNIDFDEYYSCWGQAFDSTIAIDLQRTIAGQTWLTTTSAKVKPTVSEEIALWKSKHIVSFTTQWQNFKLIGYLNSYNIVNAYDASYQFTLRSQYSKFRLNEQTTFKMYWGLANDFLAATNNNSAISGCSLLRTSAAFAFSNTTAQSVLFEYSILSSPMATSLTIMSTTVGPFGAVDMIFVPCPEEITATIRLIHVVLRQALAASIKTQAMYNQISNPINAWLPVPKAWTDINFLSVGGSPVCPEATLGSGSPVTSGMLEFLRWDKTCSALAVTGTLDPDIENMVVSVILANMSYESPDRISATCAQNPQFVPECLQLLNETLGFVSLNLANYLGTFAPFVLNANNMVRELNIQFIQFGQLNTTSPVTLYELNVLDPTQPEFTYFSWHYLLDWVFGQRDVVSFRGDYGTRTVLSEYLMQTPSHVNMAENPTTLSFYLQITLVYITVSMITIAALTLLYIILARGHIEPLNLFELQRVGAMVWIGRPLLLVRSLTAIALLSTATVDLVFNGYITYFNVVSNPWYKTVLAANEVTWMVAIVNDIAMALTKEHTIYYATSNSILVWLVVVTLSLVSPIRHSMTIDNQCHLAQVDFQVICTSGYVTIGYISRLATIIFVALGCNILCYVATRTVVQTPSPNKIDSCFVYAGGRYLFLTSDWVHDDVYYMDRASATLNGILTLRWRRVMFGFDLKLWRVFQVDLHKNMLDISPNHKLADAAKFAIPLNVNLSRC
ncbi:Aste57867_25132 [Aphanomyces stellatus]|uniref:Aste57867_25132 protein n=1 Tax=Aphanomyces stellatus TaxID=120398 RepID=A0A485LSC8_9STRA|nr:hypothetical protein As57867_025054 [Aphanomyces stellatus]VFU01763.1 Aste57867_25132 [Aphanomyces stellatus]